MKVKLHNLSTPENFEKISNLVFYYFIFSRKKTSYNGYPEEPLNHSMSYRPDPIGGRGTPEGYSREYDEREHRGYSKIPPTGLPALDENYVTGKKKKGKRVLPMAHDDDF